MFICCQPNFPSLKYLYSDVVITQGSKTLRDLQIPVWLACPALC